VAYCLSLSKFCLESTSLTLAWVDLYNPNSVSCSSPTECNNQFAETNDAVTVQTDHLDGLITVDNSNGQKCVILLDNGDLIKRTCGAGASAICYCQRELTCLVSPLNVHSASGCTDPPPVPASSNALVSSFTGHAAHGDKVGVIRAIKIRFSIP